MNIQKVSMGQNSLFTHVAPTHQRSCVSYIDHNRTQYNFNCCSHSYNYTDTVKAETKAIGHKPRSNAVIAFSTVVQMPKPYFERARVRFWEESSFLHQFFRSIYECLKSFYHLLEEDVVSAWVHMDEQTPHMHFIAMPLIHEENRTRLSFDEKVTIWSYRHLHPDVQQMMVNRGYADIELVNGAAMHKTVRQMRAEAIAMGSIDVAKKKLELNAVSGEVEKKKAELEDSSERLSGVENQIKKEQETLRTVRSVSVRKHKKEDDQYQDLYEKHKDDFLAYMKMHPEKTNQEEKRLLCGKEEKKQDRKGRTL